MKIKTRPYAYQRKGVGFVKKHAGVALIADDMGLGKTLQAFLYAYTYLRLQKRPMVFVCQATIKWEIQEQARTHFGVHAVVLEGRKPNQALPKSPIYVINYEILESWVDTLLALKPGIVVLDECFPANTLIETNQGPIPISTIVEEELTVKVRSLCLQTGKLTWKKITSVRKTRRLQRLVEITHEYGKLTCTEDHQIWTTNRGYVHAGLLNSNDRLQVVYEPVHSSTVRGKKTPVLRMQLCGEMEDNTTRVASKSLYRKPEHKDRQSETRSTESGSVKTYALAQPDESTGVHKEGETDKTKKRHAARLARKERRQRPTYLTTSPAAQPTGPAMGNRDSNSHQNAQELWVPSSLQSGYRTQVVEDRDRGRRGRTSKKKRPRPKKGTLIAESRVVGVTILERTGRLKHREGAADDSFVYCLEVEKTHNFFADGVLVSNCQMIKNRSAKRSKASVRLARKVKKKIGMSGTPIENDAWEFFTILNILWPHEFPSFKRFAIRYCNPKKTRFGMTFKGCSRPKELRRRLLKLGMIRRLKTDVIKDLPPKTITVEPVDLPDMQTYRTAEKDLIAWLKATKGKRGTGKRDTERHVRFMTLLKLAGELKMPVNVNWIDNFTATGKKLLVFGWNLSVMNGLKEHYGESAALITGKVKGIRRKEAINKFNYHKGCDKLFGNIQAAGVGWSCKSSSSVLFVQFAWNMSKMNQAMDRVHGVGRGVTGEPVFVWMLVARNTVEEDMLSILQKKGKTVGHILDGKEFDESKLLDKLEDRLLERGLITARKKKS